MLQFFNAVRPAKIVGDGSVADLVKWIEKYVAILFPENGIEYWADNSQLKTGILKANQVVPKSGLAEKDVHHVACYVRPGNCEGRIIMVTLSLRDGSYETVAWAKTFGRAEESWKIAEAIDEALNSLLFYEQRPELVDMSAKLPRKYAFDRHTSLKYEVAIHRGSDSILVISDGGLLLEAISWTGQPAAAVHYVKAYAIDWMVVLTTAKVRWRVIDEPLRQMIREDLPGYVISNRGVPETTGWYVLPPGGIPHDDRTYLGYFKTDEAAITAARAHQASVSAAAA